VVIKVVTDSTADISPQLAQEMGITVVPVYVRFGGRVYRDGVDITQDEFYQKLASSPVYPSTSQPTPADFANVYTGLAKETGEVISIHLSRKTSGTYESALQGREMASPACQVEVVDSMSVSMGLGLVTLVAARLAKAGESLPTILSEVSRQFNRPASTGCWIP